MRILALCRSMPWHIAGGMENHAWDLVRGLAERGDEVHLLSTAAPPGRSAPASTERLRIHTLGAGRAGRYSIAVFRALAREARRLDRQLRFDVVHSQGFAAYALPGGLASRLAVTIHGTLTSETPLYPPEFRRLNWRERLRAIWRHKGRLASAPLYLRMLRAARIVLVDSDFTRRELSRARPWLHQKIRLVPLGLHPERVPPPREPRVLLAPPVRMLSVGRLTEAKGMGVALEAVARLPPEGWRWAVAGTGPQLDQLRQRAVELGLAGRVEFLGFVPPERLWALQGESDLFIYPELGRPAFGLVALEAMLASLPVVASRRGAIPEVVGEEGGWLVEGADPAALAEQLAALIADPSQIAAKARRCRQAALDGFSYERMVEETRKALEEAAQPSPM